MKIGCIAIAPLSVGKFLGIECAKGRGIILPGGSYEEGRDESFHHAAARELFEETGAKVSPNCLDYIWHGPDGFEHTTFAFLARHFTDVQIGRQLPEGTTCEATWDQLFKSKFGAYYRVLADVEQLTMTARRQSSWGHYFK